MIDFSLYPNLNGNLGENKVAIPDGVTTFWPDGDALVGNFIYKDGKLVGFVDTKALITNESKSTVLPYDYVDITVDKRLESLMTFNAGDRCKHLNVKYEVYLPKGYKKLEYLESTGTQYIDTRYVPQIGDALSIINLTLIGTQGNIFSSTNDGNDPKFILVNMTPIYYKYFSSGAAPHFNRSIITPNSRLYIDGDGCLFVNGKIVSQATAQGGVTGTLLFAERAAMTWGQITISRNGQLQLNLIPCLDDTGTPCMYDIISQEPFYNEGTGQFLYTGAESQVVTSDLDEIFYAKMTEHGIQKLYHVPENYKGTKDDYAIENGFKQLVEPPMPTEGYWSPQWIETDTQLICNWVEADVSEI